MPNLTADRVKETTTTTGTGTITLAGAVAQFRTFASAFADGSVVQYAIVGQTGTEWEVGNGTFTASGTTLARTTVLASSNAGAAVNFGAGVKDVFATITAAELLAHVVGPASATDNAVMVYDQTTGKLAKNSTVTIVDGKITLGGGGSRTAPALALPGGHAGFFDDWGTGGLAMEFDASTTFSVINHLGVYKLLLDTSQLQLPQNHRFGWGIVGGVSTAGLARHADGVIRSTNGVDGIRSLLGGGAAVASAATLPAPTGRVFHVTGTTNITSITSTEFEAGATITMIFDGVLTVTDGGNLKLAGNFVTAADSTLSLVYDGANWFETSRSTN